MCAAPVRCCMSKHDVPWVLIVARGASAEEPNAHLLCERCDARQVQGFPMSVDAFTRQSKAFIAQHSACPLRSRESA